MKFKKVFFSLCILLSAVAFSGVVAPSVQAQAKHTGSLTWTPSADYSTVACTLPNICSQTVYRESAICGSGVLVKIATVDAAVATYVDNAPLFGSSCYAVTFTINGVESANSNASGGSLRPAAQTALSTLLK